VDRVDGVAGAVDSLVASQRRISPRVGRLLAIPADDRGQCRHPVFEIPDRVEVHLQPGDVRLAELAPEAGAARHHRVEDALARALLEVLLRNLLWREPAG